MRVADSIILLSKLSAECRLNQLGMQPVSAFNLDPQSRRLSLRHAWLDGVDIETSAHCHDDVGTPTDVGTPIEQAPKQMFSSGGAVGDQRGVNWACLEQKNQENHVFHQKTQIFPKSW